MNRNFYNKYRLFDTKYLKKGMFVIPKGKTDQYLIKDIKGDIIYLSNRSEEIMADKKTFAENYLLIKFLDTTVYQEEMIFSPKDLMPVRINDKRLYGLYKNKYVVNSSGDIYKVLGRALKDKKKNEYIFYLDKGDFNVIEKHYDELIDDYKLIVDKYIHLI